MEKVNCVSCKKEIINMPGTSRFDCPECGKVEIIRCPDCRKVCAKYKCSSCGFEGPN